MCSSVPPRTAAPVSSVARKKAHTHICNALKRTTSTARRHMHRCRAPSPEPELARFATIATPALNFFPGIDDTPHRPSERSYGDSAGSDSEIRYPSKRIDSRPTAGGHSQRNHMSQPCPFPDHPIPPPVDDSKTIHRKLNWTKSRTLKARRELWRLQRGAKVSRHVYAFHWAL